VIKIVAITLYAWHLQGEMNMVKFISSETWDETELARLLPKER